jgi:allantoinase
MVHALRARRVITPAGSLDAAVVIDGERIAAIKPAHELSADVPMHDLGELALLPGLIDVHTHINEPGRTEWEGFVTATRAAAAGGFTTVIDMPLNNLPETTTVAALEAKREATYTSTSEEHRSSKCLIDYALWGGCVDGNQQHLEPLAAAGVAGFKSFLIYPGCDGFTEIDRANLEAAIPHLVRTGLPLLVHAELAPAIEAATEDLNHLDANWRRYKTYLTSRPDEAELDAIAMLLELCRRYRFRLHIVHLSTAKALPMITAAKREGLPLTVETCPHYLHLTAEQIADGATQFKCAPPIRSAANREQLWQALLDGTIDLIATDHSPCPPAMKKLDRATAGDDAGRFDKAWGGIASLSTAVSVVWTECVARGLSLRQLAQWMAAAPAQMAGLDARVGSITPGKHANFVVFDPEASFTLETGHLHYRHAISPYIGEVLRGRVQTTWLRGSVVYEIDDSPSAFKYPARGREYAIS